MLTDKKLSAKRTKRAQKRAKAKKAKRGQNMTSDTKQLNAGFNPTKEQMVEGIMHLYEIQANVQVALTRLERMLFGLIKLNIEDKKVTGADLEDCSKAVLAYDTIGEFWEADYDEALAKGEAREAAIQAEAEAAQQIQDAKEALQQIKADAGSLDVTLDKLAEDAGISEDQLDELIQASAEDTVSQEAIAAS